MTNRTNCHFFFDEDTKEIVWIVSAYLTKLKKYAKAGKHGKDLYCPHCHFQHRVYNFRWTCADCHNCGKILKRSEWLVATNPTKMSKRLTLCDPKVKYYIDKDSVGKIDERGTRLDAKYSPKSINSHF